MRYYLFVFLLLAGLPDAPKTYHTAEGVVEECSRDAQRYAQEIIGNGISGESIFDVTQTEIVPKTIVTIQAETGKVLITESILKCDVCWEIRAAGSPSRGLGGNIQYRKQGWDVISDNLVCDQCMARARSKMLEQMSEAEQVHDPLRRNELLRRIVEAAKEERK